MSEPSEHEEEFGDISPEAFEAAEVVCALFGEVRSADRLRGTALIVQRLGIDASAAVVDETIGTDMIAQHAEPVGQTVTLRRDGEAVASNVIDERRETRCHADAVEYTKEWLSLKREGFDEEEVGNLVDVLLEKISKLAAGLEAMRARNEYLERNFVIVREALEGLHRQIDGLRP